MVVASRRRQGPVYFAGVWCHGSPAPDKVRGCNPAKASLRPQAAAAGAGQWSLKILVPHSNGKIFSTARGREA
jgi:hypothetical protein